MFLLADLIFLLLINASLVASTSTPESLSYEAGVVEFTYGNNRISDPIALLESNLNQYLEIMTDAPLNLDIIVFPEMTLNQLQTAFEIPEIEQRVSPCDNDSFPTENAVKRISCAAKAFRRYVVVNMVTKAKCPDADMIAQMDPRNCTDREDGFSYYNTNVVFDRSGTLISRYRKFNLFGERVDKPFKPSIVYFDTDFGVRFGHFICFDLQFRSPALDLVREYNITDIVFTSMWYSELPFLTAVQLQKYWAFATNVNLLAAGSNYPRVASTGSGIYAGRKGSLTSVMEGAISSQLYTATVPKRGLGDHIQVDEQIIRYSKHEMASLDLWRDQLEPYTISFLDDKTQLDGNAMQSLEQCSGDLCCTLHYNIETMTTTVPHYKYAFAVYHGKRTFSGLADGGVVACAVIACQSDDVATCGVRNENLEFVHHWHKLEIFGTFPISDQYIYMPNSLDSSIMPLGVNEMIFEQETGPSEANIKIDLRNSSRQDLYTFGIYGRDFNLDVDVDESTGSGKAMRTCSMSILTVGFVTLLLLLQ